MALDYDVIVIGSGFGGAITACRLSEAGWRVLVLERGRRWSTSSYPRKVDDDWLWVHHQPEKYNGWLDLRVYRNMSVASGAGVGGGSLIYANISCNAPERAFSNGWPKSITYKRMETYYAMVASFMEVEKVPENQWPGRAHLMHEAAQKGGYLNRFQRLDLAVRFDDEWSPHNPGAYDYASAKTVRNKHGILQKTCVHCGLCDVGCPVDAKNTLDKNYLPVAEKHGAEIRPLHLVEDIQSLGVGYRVVYDDLTSGERIRGGATAAKVVVAAGSMGSTELLLKCKHVTKSLQGISKRLGYNWSCNGDLLTPSYHKGRAISPTNGPTITSAIDFHLMTDPEPSFWVQDGGLFDLLKPALAAHQKWVAKHIPISFITNAEELLLGKREPYKSYMPWFGQAMDAGNGKLSLKYPWWDFFGFFADKKLHLAWNPKKSSAAIDALYEMQKLLAETTDGDIVPFYWRLLHRLITPHPLGGCNMANSPIDGVVDGGGKVFGYDGLYVIDGAIIPRPLGVNPSRTIGALAELISEEMVKDGRPR